MLLYEGDKDYIFISYSHRDEKEVMRITERLVRDGYRVWYDGGIEPGSEWPETVATHLKDCALFLAFISGSYLDSFNCKREIDYAVSKRKPFISVYLEDVQMTPGMEMQLSGVQSVFRYEMNEESFFERLCGSELLRSSREEGSDLPADKKQEDGEKESPQETGKRITPLKMAVITAAVAAAVTVLFLISRSYTDINIGGTEISRMENYLSLDSSELSKEDIGEITRLSQLRTLKLKDCDLEAGAGQLRKLGGSLTSLKMEGCTGIEDYAWISELKSLETLEITDCGMKDTDLDAMDLSGLEALKNISFEGDSELAGINALKEVKGLTRLDISGTGVSDLSPLSALEGMYALNISDTKVSELSPLSDLTGLKELRLNDCGVSTLKPLGELKELKLLSADRNRLSDLKGLGDKEALETLSVAGNSLKSLEGLESAFRLKTVIAYGNELASVDALSSCTGLENADLHDNLLTDVSVLSKSAEHLVRLDLSGNSLTDMSALKGMQSLIKIILDDNGISDISFIRDSAALEYISAEHNKIASFEPLEELAALKYLYLSDNEIQGKVRLENMPALSNVSLQHNRIDEITFSSEERETVLGIPIHISYIAAYDDPLVTIKDVYGEGGISEGYLSFPQTEETLTLFRQVFISDCPYDERLKLEEAVSSIEYTTSVQMDEKLGERKGETGITPDLQVDL